jgi:hypothetical protein
MRAVIGGTVVGAEPWSYKDKTTGSDVQMFSVFLAGQNKYNDKIVIPADLGPCPEVGATVFYVADVSVNSREYKGKTYADLSVWCRSIATDPFAVQLAAVEGGRKTA